MTEWIKLTLRILSFLSPLILGFATTLEATSLVSQSVEELTHQSEYVVEGCVVEQKNVILSGTPVTRHSISVRQSLSGPWAADEIMYVYSVGGKIGDQEVRVAGNEHLIGMGKNPCYFLWFNSDHFIQWVTYQLVKNEGGQEVAVRRGDEISLKSRNSGNHATAWSHQVATPDDLRSKVFRALNDR